MTALIRMFLEQHVEKFRPVTEIGAFEHLESGDQINHAAFCCEIEYAERSRNLEALVHGNGCTLAIIDRHEIGLEEETKHNG